MLDRSKVRPLAAVVLILTTACAVPFHEPGASATRPTAQILIDNQANDIPEMTVTLVPRYGVPKLLGTVRFNEMKAFKVRESAAGSAYQLIARPIGGRPMTSALFMLSAGDSFEWDTRLNSIFFRGRMAAAR